MLFEFSKLVLGTSTARSKIRSARSKICPLEERSCSKCSKKVALELARLEFFMLEMLEVRSVWNTKNQLFLMNFL